MSDPAMRLSGRDLHLWRGERALITGLGFEAEAGCCLLITGPNGSGKTSLLRAICGLLPLEQGVVEWRGLDVRRDRYAFHSELAYLSHDVALKGDLTAAENLCYEVGLRRTVQPAEIATALDRVGAGSITDLPVRHMSAGQKRRVAFARVLLCECPLWLLDEPMSNLDVAGQALFGEVLDGHLAGGGIALVATHQSLGVRAGTIRTVSLG